MSREVSTIIRRGDIWMADLRIGTIGSEQGEIRPVLVVQNNIGNKHSPTVTIIPLTSKRKNNLPTHVVISESFLPTLSVALAEQIRTIDKSRLIKYMGELNENIMSKINNAITIQMGLFDNLMITA